MKILVFGYGNPGRQDDGLGPLLVSRLEQEGFPHVTFDSDYQLNIEDAATLADYDAVIFIDATVEDVPPFSFTELHPALKITFTTHSISAESLVALTTELFDKRVKSYMLAIPGYEWEVMNETISEGAKENADKAYSFMMQLLSNPTEETFNHALDGLSLQS